MYNEKSILDGNYVMYLRKSRADRDAEMRGEGETLARHEKTLVELAKRLDIKISSVYREVVSGESIESRPEVQKMLREVEQGIYDGVFVMEVERLARGDTTDQGTIAKIFKYSSTKIITPAKTYDPENESDEEYFEFGLFMSRREYKTINRRLQNGRIRSVMDGKYIGSVAPFGYDKVPIKNDKGFTLQPNNDAETVKLIYEWYTVGIKNGDGDMERIGINLITNRLNKLHFKPLKNEKFSGSTVRDILKNEIYYGMISWNKSKVVKTIENGIVTISRPRSKEYNLYQGLHHPVISKETFDKAQYFLSKNPPTSVNRRNITKNPLSGLVICAKCGRKMTRRPYNERRKNDSLICQYTDCDNISSDLYLVEDRIIESIGNWIAEFKNEFSEECLKNSNTIDITEDTIKRLSDELDDLNNQMEKTYGFLEKGLYTDVEFVKRRSYLQDRISEIENTILELKEEKEMDKKIMNQREFIMPKLENIVLSYGLAESPKVKNEMLKEVIDHVTYLKEENGRWHGKTDGFILEIVPKIF